MSLPCGLRKVRSVLRDAVKAVRPSRSLTYIRPITRRVSCTTRWCDVPFLVVGRNNESLLVARMPIPVLAQPADFSREASVRVSALLMPSNSIESARATISPHAISHSVDNGRNPHEYSNTRLLPLSLSAPSWFMNPGLENCEKVK